MTPETKWYLNHMDLIDVWANIDCFLTSGVKIDEIIDLGEPRDGFFAENYNKLISLGADPQKLPELT